MKKTNKSSTPEQRVSFINDCLASGMSRKDVLKAWKKQFKMNEATFYTDVKKVGVGRSIDNTGSMVGVQKHNTMSNPEFSETDMLRFGQFILGNKTNAERELSRFKLAKEIFE